MYPNNNVKQYPASYNGSMQNGQPYGSNDERLIGGGFLGPFLLGGITGGLLAPAFYGPGYGYGRPVYNTYYYPSYPPTPYPYYGPYYR